MISLRMRADAKPHCDRHPRRPMTLVFLQIEPGIDKPWQPAFVCGETNCPRHYNLARGYFNVFKRRVDPDTRRCIPCPHDSLPMYLEQVDSHSGMWVWRCAQLGCDGSSMQMATSG